MVTASAAFEHDGTHKWTSTVGFISSSAPTIGDLDGDGSPEIAFGARVINADGTLRFLGTANAGRSGLMQLAAIADIDLDGTPELVAGSTAYAPDGTVIWTHGFDGLAAVGQFDEDETAEIAITTARRLLVLEHDGSISLPIEPLPGFGEYGPPTVADFDGDGLDEIAVGNDTDLLVLKGNGNVLWRIAIDAPRGLGITAFDFDGDGRSEVVYADDEGLKIARGSDGATLSQVPFGGVQHTHLPIVADVDGDGRAELVAVGSPADVPGVYVYGDSLDNWIGARGVWNEYAYQATNIRDDLTLPANPEASWLASSGQREQRLAGAFRFAAGDVSASFLRIAPAGDDLELIARIGNAGAEAVPAGVSVGFYEGSPKPAVCCWDPPRLLESWRPGATRT